jgi:hypothetical protein
MKRLLGLLAVLVLIVSCAWAENAVEATEDSRDADLLDIWQMDGENRRWITAAVQAMDGMLVTSPATLPERTDGLTVSDGQKEWEVEAVIPDSTGAVAMVFYDTSRNLPAKSAWPMMAYGDSVQASTCTVRSGDETGGRTDTKVLSAASLQWRNSRVLLLNLEDKVSPGTAVLNARGELVGVVFAEYAEGLNRVLAMPVEEIVRCMTEAGDLLIHLGSWGDPPEGFRVTADRNFVTIDWSGMTLPEKTEGENLYLVIADLANDYLNFYPAETKTRNFSAILTPGRIYVSGILASAQSPSDLPEHFEVTVVPPAQKLTEYGFHPILTAVAEMPADAKDGDAPMPVTEVTEELLRSGRAYFYSASAYEVEEQIEGKTLLVTLTDPQGNVYRYESSWMYAPEYMKEDIWFIPLTESGLIWSLNQDGYPKGEYQMAYYVEGELADSFTFEIQ